MKVRYCFTRFLCMNVDLYKYLENKSVNGVVSVSKKTMCYDTGLSMHMVKLRLKKLYENGNIEIYNITSEDGSCTSNTYRLIKPPNITIRKDVDVQKVKAIYFWLIKLRDKSAVLNKWSFINDTNKFIQIHDICVKNNFDLKTYMLSCFHTFNENWCLKTFKKKYPPPNVMASAKNSVERYNNYIRYLSRFNLKECDKLKSEIIEENYHVWIETGKTDDFNTLKIFIEADILSPVFVASLHVVNKVDSEEIIKKHNLNIEEIKYTKGIINELKSRNVK